MHEYLRFFGTNNQPKVDHFLIYERDLVLISSEVGGFDSIKKFMFIV